MNILCVCSRGINRSLIMATILRDEKKYRDVINIGLHNTSQETLVMLYDWADKILLVEDSFIPAIHPEYLEKVVVLNVGKDIWGHKHHPELQRKLRTLLLEKGL